MSVNFDSNQFQGATSKYEGQEDCDLLIELMSQGKDIASFCGTRRISIPTFNSWKLVHPEFAQAHYDGAALSQQFWENWMEESIIAGTVVNERAWMMMMKNRFGYTDARKVKMLGFAQAKKAAQKAEVVSDHIDRGEFTAHEAKTMTEVVKTFADIEVTGDALERLEKVEGLLNAKK